MDANDLQGVVNLSKGHGWHDLCRGTPYIAID